MWHTVCIYSTILIITLIKQVWSTIKYLNDDYRDVKKNFKSSPNWTYIHDKCMIMH